ncbi:MAG: hypothetical protein P4M08_15335 [Oligoflexia bacterium]|nr:hypothetical protein [Oligoflexia bacterium]
MRQPESVCFATVVQIGTPVIPETTQVRITTPFITGTISRDQGATRSQEM